MKPVEPEPVICLHCDAELRDSAVFCDRCGTARAPRPVQPAAAPWGFVVALALLLGLAVGGGLGVWFGLRNAAAPRESATVKAPPPDTQNDAGANAPKAAAPDAADRHATDAQPVAKSTAGSTPASASDSVATPYTPGALRLAASTADGDALPLAPAVAIGPSLVLAPLSAIEDAAQASVRAANGTTHDVLGVVRHDAAYDLALLEIAGEVLPASKGVRADAIMRQESGALVPVDPSDGEEQPLWFKPGDPDSFSGGPRLALEAPARGPSVLVDYDGRVVGLAAGQDGRALALHVAASWASGPTASVPLDQFRRSLGQTSGGSRVREARRLLAQRRYAEAARLFLDVLAVEPQRLAEVSVDLVTAAREAARELLGAGNADGANTLAAAALARVPNAAELHAARGRALGALDNVVGAIDELLVAATLERERATTWTSEARGILLSAVDRMRDQNRLTEALGLLSNEAAKFPTDGGLLVAAGDLALSLRQFQFAADVFGRAARIDASVAADARPRAQRAADLAGGLGAIVLDFAPGATDIIVSARVNASATLNLRLDPANKDVVLTANAARAAGYMVASLPRVRSSTEPSADEIPTAKLQSIAVSGVSANGVQILVNDAAVGGGADGVLGQNWLGRFRVVEDRSLGRMVLWPR